MRRVLLAAVCALFTLPASAWEVKRSTDRMTRSDSVWIEQASVESFDTDTSDKQPAYLSVRCLAIGPAIGFFGWQQIAVQGSFATTRWRLDPIDKTGRLVWHSSRDLLILLVMNDTTQMPYLSGARQAPVVSELLKLMLAAETLTIEVALATGVTAYPTFAMAGLRQALQDLDNGRCLPRG